MTTQGPQHKSDLKAFEYVLEDFLEVKAAFTSQMMGPLKAFLLSKGFGNFILSTIEGFCLDEQLVLIRQGDPRSFEHLVFLNPENGRIRVRPLLS